MALIALLAFVPQPGMASELPKVVDHERCTCHPNARPFSLPEKIPGDYEGKWYGMHCPDIPREHLIGVRHGEAFPDQKIIDAWGYKAKPVEEIKDLLPEIYYNMVANPQSWGPIRVNETAYIPLEQFPGEHQKIRMEVTKKNLGTSRLDEKGHLVNWEAGFPFPGSTKPWEIIWNFVNSRNYGEDLLAHFYAVPTDKRGHKRWAVIDTTYLWWTGRLHGEHKPCYEPNPHDYEFYNAMCFKTPYDLHGLICLTHRYNNADKQDDMWMYLTMLRRVRRMSTAQRWDKLPGGQDLTWDAVTGFQGKPTNYKWKYLGRKELLCMRQAKDQIQEIKDKPAGACDQLYQRVNVIMLEYEPQIISAVARSVMYLDPEIYSCYYVEFYDKRGRPYLFYAHPWVIQASGYQSPIGFTVADVQRTHTSNVNTFDEYQDLDAEAVGINPAFFQMDYLKKLYGSR